jgi:hypothetical protein
LIRSWRIALVAAVLFTASPLQGRASAQGAGQGAVPAQSEGQSEEESDEDPLSPFWGPTIQQWSDYIRHEAEATGIDPDFVAAVVDAESNGMPLGISRAGAVGLMGVMPSGPGLEWRPSSEALIDPQTNLNWGVAILTAIIRQSGGDISAALAAYSGGWAQVNMRVPRQYAQRVLDKYARAVVVRTNGRPEIASEWTIATEIRGGNVPVDGLIVNQQPLSGLRMYGEHVVYQNVDAHGRSLYVKAYAVPVALVVSMERDPAASRSDLVDSQLMARLGMGELKVSDSNPRLILACLPSLTRLRGHQATRWFAPSSCPDWHR